MYIRLISSVPPLYLYQYISDVRAFFTQLSVLRCVPFGVTLLYTHYFVVSTNATLVASPLNRTYGNARTKRVRDRERIFRFCPNDGEYRLAPPIAVTIGRFVIHDDATLRAGRGQKYVRQNLKLYLIHTTTDELPYRNFCKRKKMSLPRHRS